MDFTFKTYEKLLNSLLARGFSFMTYAQYEEVKVEVKAKVSPHPQPQPQSQPQVLDSLNQQINESTNQPTNKLTSQQANKRIILRHDVEDRYLNALRMAQIEHRMGIMGSYYFRLFPVADNDRIISQIAALGHEVGYHYDDLSVCNGRYEEAITRFNRNVAHLRQFGAVTTITMEGAPRSRFDNRMLWLGRIDKELKASENVTSNLKVEGQLSRKQRLPDFYHQVPANHSKLPHYDYHDFGITTEPYFDLDFNQFFYLTDTGRCWDGWNVSVRDKVPQQEEWVKQGLVFHSTAQIIRAANEGRLPDKIMMTFHPQRWTDNHVLWLKELVLQRLKNVVKRGLVRL